MLSRQGIQFLVVIVLARLLAPEDFGVIALLAFFTSLSIAFVQGGLSIAIIQRQQTSADEESAIFWWNLAGSIVLGSVIALAGPAFAYFFDQPVLRTLVFIAAAQVVLSAAAAVHIARATRDMRFDLLTKAGLVASLGSAILTIIAALSGWGLWALAVQILASSFLNTAAMWLAVPWRPTRHFRFATIRQLFGFGAWVTVGNIMEAVYTNGIALLIGKLHGVRDLGFYNQANATQMIPGTALSAIVGRVALPLLASNQHDPDAMRGSMRLAIRCVMLLNIPAMLGLALLSDLVIAVLFGPKWLSAASVLSILALGGILYPMHIINVQYVLATGQTATFMRNEITKKILGLTCVVIGSFFGIVGLAWSQVVYSVLGLIVNAGPARRNLNYGPARQLADLAAIAIVTLIMAAAVQLLRVSLSDGPVVMLALCTLAGAAIFAVVGWLSASTVFRDPVNFLIEAFKGVPAGAGR